MSDASMDTEFSKAGLDPSSDHAQGKLRIVLAKSGEPRREWNLTSFDVVLVRFGEQASIQGTASGDVTTPFDLAIDFAAKSFVLKISFDGRHHVWSINTSDPGISIRAASNPEQLLIQVLSNFTFYGHYNLMAGSVLAVRASA